MSTSKPYDLHEAVHSSKSKWDDFYNLIDRFIAQGYSKTDEESEDKEGLDHEQIALIITAELKPPNFDLPLIKLEAKETFGVYDYDNETFQKWDGSKFELKAWKKGSGSGHFKDRWEPFDLS